MSLAEPKPGAPPEKQVPPAPTGGNHCSDQAGGAIGAKSTTMVAAALEAAAAGWSVLPCWPAGPRAKSPVAFLVPHGHLQASVDRDVIRAWWRRCPDAMIGAPVPVPLLVIDIDPRNGGSLESVETACSATLPTTLTVWSGRCDGGRHLYFRRPAGELSSTRLPPGVDLKTSAGYAIIPPSLHPATGAGYMWQHHPVAELPAGLRALLRPAPRPDFTFRPAGNVGKRSAALLLKLSTATVGERNALLYWAASRAAESGVLDDLAPELLRVAEGLGMPTGEARRTVESAGARTRAPR